MSYRETIANWDGNDADLLTYLNTPRHKRVVGDGMVTLLMVMAVDEAIATNLNYTIEQSIEYMRSQGQHPQASSMDKVLKRFAESSYGADFANDSLRNQLTTILLGSGWNQADIDTCLSLGAVYDSEAFQELGRDAVQADVDQVRLELWVKDMQARAVNASAQMQSRVEQLKEIATEQQLIDMWAAAFIAMDEVIQ